MQELIIGTTNSAKIAHIQAALDPLGIKAKSIGDFGKMPDVLEDGKTPEENAIKKATIYAKAINKPVLSMDISLYLDGVREGEQPKTNVRRIPNHDSRPTDEEILKYYSNLIQKYGGNITGKWYFAMCYAFPDGTIKQATTKSEDRIFTNIVCEKRMSGYPLESLQIDQKLGKYIVEMSEDEQKKFWQKSIGKELKELLS